MSWKEDSNNRRDIRNIKISDEQTKVPNNRNTKKWCKGKIGHEHKLECKKYNDIKKPGNHRTSWRILFCSNCGKEIDIYYGTKRKPDWVIS